MNRNRRLILLLVLFTYLALFDRSYASEIRLTDNTGSSTDPHICSLGNGTGDLSVVWIDNRNGSEQVFFTRVTSLGAKLLPDIAVSSAVSASSLPSCAVDSAGATHIAWKQADALMYAKLNSAGGILVAPFIRVAAPIDYPHIDVEPNGNGHIVWVDTTLPRRVKYRKINSSGGNFSGCNEIVYDTGDYSNTTEFPFILAPGSGNVYAFVSWHGDDVGYPHLLDITLPYPGCNDRNGPYWQTNDVPIGRTAMIENQTAENAFLVFEAHTDTPLQHVYSLSGAGTYKQLDSGIGPAFYPSISSVSNSQVFIVWEDRRYGDPWILGQALNGTSDTLVGGNCRISDGRSAARRPTITRAGPATFGIVWDDDRHGDEEIYLSISGPSCSEFEVIDPNPALVSGGAVVSDAATLVNTAGRKVSGFAADGVTPVLLRLPVTGSGTVTFEVFDESNGTMDVGTLRSPGNSEDVVALTVPTNNVGGKFWALALLMSPDRFVRTAADEPREARPVLIRATFDPDIGVNSVVERTIDVRRPPVLLLHGLWSRAQSWGWDLLTDPRFTVYTHDYWQTNAASLATNQFEARRGVAGALEKIRDRGIAATQVDAYGHSMGGLLLRKHRAGSFYAVDANLRAGDLHTLVTVDTPHRGSPWADVLLSAPFIHPLMMNLGKCVTCGALDDLRPTSSEITSLPEALLPAHAFVGKGGSDLIQQALIASAPRELRAFLLVAKFAGLLPEDLFPPALQHDMIVGRTSQEGGLASGSSQTSLFGFVSVSPRNMGLHAYSVEVESQVNDRALELLNTAASDGATFAAGFPAAPTSSMIETPKWILSMPETTTGGIMITSPLNGSVVTAGTTVEITVAPYGGFAPTQVLITTPYDAAEIDTAPFMATFEVPEDATGDFTVRAAASDGTGYAMSTEIHLEITVPATLVSISTNPSMIYLFSPPDRRPLNVVGHYSDGIDRDLTPSMVGTTYDTTDPSVVTIDEDGMMTSIKEGIAVVTVSNGMLASQAVVQVKRQVVLLEMDYQGLKWPEMEGAIGYDVVRGDIGILKGTLGEYELAIAECVADDWQSTSLPYTQEPLPGEAFFYLMRPVRAGGPRSYDAYEFGASRQFASRDPGIGQAFDNCP